ncbi:hypothetical protein SESBI_17003 [Sesbania bispinosa]|nr:hypothetical protein SESBI_17003 [Sesbania bispinosa]
MRKIQINRQNDEIMELLWQNGQVVMQSQNQRPLRKPPPPAINTGDGMIPAREIPSSEAPENYSNQHLFMQEDEMASWLHDSIHEILPSIITISAPTSSAILRHRHPAEPGPSSSSKATAVRESTVVDSCETPITAATAAAKAAAVSKLSETVRSSADYGRGSMSAAGKAASAGGKGDGDV